MTGDDNHDGDKLETSNTTPPVPPPTQQIPHTVSSIKLPILKKGEYDMWAMKMKHYLSHTDYPICNRSRMEMSLHKGYDMFQTLLSQLEIHGAGTTTSSSSDTQNVPFVSADDTSSTNDINDDDMEEMDLKWQVAMISMRIKKFHKRTGRKLQFDTKDPVGFDKTKVECFNSHKMGHFARDCRAKRNQDTRRKDTGYNRNKASDNGRRPAYQDDSKALVTIDG
uniref:Ribonuclease H-like domain-containing protein n=1 Tax=Tanacetum cinerariifolium TaxID=118510 RepID=A0A699JG72_TANCI|nr:ribonuclease H-like domain-containing protein [Tanacetum cinerariifolium]